jgi:hypothetical protein
LTIRLLLLWRIGLSNVANLKVLSYFDFLHQGEVKSNALGCVWNIITSIFLKFVIGGDMKRNWVFFGVIVFLAAVFGWAVSRLSLSVPLRANESTPEVVVIETDALVRTAYPPPIETAIVPTVLEIQKQLAVREWVFDVVEKDQMPSGTLTYDQAMEALRRSPFGIGVDQAFSIVGYSGWLTNSVLQQSREEGNVVDPVFASPKLVWFMVLVGPNTFLNSLDQQGDKISSIYVILDAQTGEYLRGMQLDIAGQ